jgi:ArsR family transcriptional regulator
MRRFKAEVFQALAHPTRVAIVEHLAQGELSVGQLCAKVEIGQANASKHLSILRSKHIVQARKAGNQTFYRLRDPAFGKVLSALREYFLAHVAEVLQLLQREQAQAENLQTGPASPASKARRRAQG